MVAGHRSGTPGPAPSRSRSRSCGPGRTSRTGYWNAAAWERALTTVVATCYLLGVSTRRMEKLVETLGITRLSKSQVSVMAKELDEQVESFRTPLDVCVRRRRRVDDEGPRRGSGSERAALSRSGRRRADRETSSGRRAPRSGPNRHPHLHRVPERDTGGRSGPTTPPSVSTERSADEPTSSASSPTAPPWSGSSELSWPNNTTNVEGRRYLSVDVLASSRMTLLDATTTDHGGEAMTPPALTA